MVLNCRHSEVVEVELSGDCTQPDLSYTSGQATNTLAVPGTIVIKRSRAKNMMGIGFVAAGAFACIRGLIVALEGCTSICLYTFPYDLNIYPRLSSFILCWYISLENT